MHIPNSFFAKYSATCFNENVNYIYPEPFTFVACYRVNGKYMQIDLIKGKNYHSSLTGVAFSYNPKIIQEWTFIEKIISGDLVTPEYVSRGYKKIDGVPYYLVDDPNGCALTAAAMVISYWHSNGYPSFPSDEEKLEDLFKQHFDYDPNTGTTVSSIAPGYEKFASDYGYSFDSWTSENNYWDYVYEIDHNRPVTVALIDSETYGDHAVVGVGYEYVYPYSEYLWIHDGWTQSDVKINVNEAQNIYYIPLKPT